MNRSINNKNPDRASSKTANRDAYLDVQTDVQITRAPVVKDTAISIYKSKTNIFISVLLIVGIVGAINFCRTLNSEFWPQTSFMMIVLGFLGLILAVGKYCFDFLRRRKIVGSGVHDKQITGQPLYHAILTTGYLVGFLLSFFVLWASSI